MKTGNGPAPAGSLTTMVLVVLHVPSSTNSSSLALYVSVVVVTDAERGSSAWTACSLGDDPHPAASRNGTVEKSFLARPGCPSRTPVLIAVHPSLQPGGALPRAGRADGN